MKLVYNTKVKEKAVLFSLLRKLFFFLFLCHLLLQDDLTGGHLVCRHIRSFLFSLYEMLIDAYPSTFNR